LCFSVYSDVVPQFKKWTSDGKKLYIFSSGSVEAQKLLFGHTTEGDVTSMIADYFDTEVGPKVEKESYTKIAEKIGKPVGEIVFYTDVVKEADAAKEAGMPVVVVAREGNTPLTDEEKTKFTVVTTFEVEEAEEVPAKKQKLDEEAVAVEEKAAAVEEKPAAVEEKSAAVEEKSTDVEMKSTEVISSF
jgi:enolase-phosphatase E1